MASEIKKIVITKGPTKELPLFVELQDDKNECVGSCYVISFIDLIKVLCNMEEKRDIPWNK